MLLTAGYSSDFKEETEKRKLISMRLEVWLIYWFLVNRIVSSDNYVFFSSYMKCWDCETIKVNEFVLDGTI